MASANTFTDTYHKEIYVGVGTNTTTSAIVNLSGVRLIRFALDRAWQFEAGGTGASSTLDLRSLNGD